MPNKTEFAIECDKLCRTYRSWTLAGGWREIAALDGLSFQVPPGVVFGLLGPNGAGKTTTLRILSTLLMPTRGTATVLGYDVVRDTNALRQVIGLMVGGERGFYGRLSGRENLRYYAALSQMRPRDAKRRVEHVLGLVGLTDRADRRVGQYSRGMKQRLHLARALLPDPTVLFLDEPTLGLDPVMAQEVRQMIPAFARQGKTVLITTHYMLEAELLCNMLCIINHGKVVAYGSPADIKQRFGASSVLEGTVTQVRKTLVEELMAIVGVERVEISADGIFAKLRVYIQHGTDLTDRILDVVGRDTIDNVMLRERTLEEAYVSILR